ncbi:hypothetical protein [Alkalicoccus urumqiensis]|uniref:Uncharacterized protein n=1 Tax=Alkalicoccus urumqiensis TaxID=1548213 RepID=A0A2P6MIL4_ALKUR|nr:hypothetical protein [Alkalicoccus urumqiensis]PRO66088.1 hypothetical protein C6I21_07260 [Alkalicoccus urumqiensis]
MDTPLLAEKVWTLSGEALCEEWERLYQKEIDPAHPDAYLQVDLFLFWCRAAEVSWEYCADRKQLEKNCYLLVHNLLHACGERQWSINEPLTALYQTGLREAAFRNQGEVQRIIPGVYPDMANENVLNALADVLAGESPETVRPLLHADHSEPMTDTQKAVLSIARTLIHSCSSRNYQLYAFLEEWRGRLEKSRMLAVSLNVHSTVAETASDMVTDLQEEEKRLLLQKEMLAKAVTAAQFRLYEAAIQKAGFLDPYTVEAQSLEEELVQSAAPLENERLRKQLTEKMLAGQFGRNLPALERLTVLLKKEQQLLQKITDLRNELKQVSREQRRSIRRMHLLTKTWHLSHHQNLLNDTPPKAPLVQEWIFPGK